LFHAGKGIIPDIAVEERKEVAIEQKSK